MGVALCEAEWGKHTCLTVKCPCSLQIPNYTVYGENVTMQNVIKSFSLKMLLTSYFERNEVFKNHSVNSLEHDPLPIHYRAVVRGILRLTLGQSRMGESKPLTTWI